MAKKGIHFWIREFAFICGFFLTLNSLKIDNKSLHKLNVQKCTGYGFLHWIKIIIKFRAHRTLLTKIMKLKFTLATTFCGTREFRRIKLTWVGYPLQTMDFPIAFVSLWIHPNRAISFHVILVPFNLNSGCPEAAFMSIAWGNQKGNLTDLKPCLEFVWSLDGGKPSHALSCSLNVQRTSRTVRRCCAATWPH